MGYYTNALLLMAAPEGERVASLFEKGAKVVVYRHVTEPLWLVDAHVPGRREHWPFQGRLPFAREGRAELPDPSESLADAYFAVHQSLAAYAGRHVASLVHDAAHAARVCGQDVVLILGDDEGNDASCRAGTDGVHAFKSRVETVALEYDGKVPLLVPFEFDEDPEAELLDDESATVLATTHGFQLAPRRLIEGGFRLYGNIVDLWPVGDPEAIAGIGTWDPFEHFERDFQVVFER